MSTDTKSVEEEKPQENINLGLEVDLLNEHLKSRKLKIADAMILLDTYRSMAMSGLMQVAGEYMMQKQFEALAKSKGVTPEQLMAMISGQVMPEPDDSADSPQDRPRAGVG